MIDVKILNIKYDYSTLYSEGEVIMQEINHVDYEFYAKGPNFDLEGKLILKEELTKAETEEKIRNLLQDKQIKLNKSV